MYERRSHTHHRIPYVQFTTYAQPQYEYQIEGLRKLTFNSRFRFAEFSK